MSGKKQPRKITRAATRRAAELQSYPKPDPVPAPPVPPADTSSTRPTMPSKPAARKRAPAKRAPVKKSPARQRLDAALKANGVEPSRPMTEAQRKERRAEQMRQRRAERPTYQLELTDALMLKLELLAHQPQYGDKAAVLRALLEEAPDPTDAGPG